MSEQISGAEVADAASETLDSSRNAAADVAETVQASARNIGDAVTRNAAHVADKVNAKFKEVASDAEPLVTAARDRTNDLRTALVDEIKSRPLQAVFAAALAGLAIGVLTTR